MTFQHDRARQRNIAMNADFLQLHILGVMGRGFYLIKNDEESNQQESEINQVWLKTIYYLP